jgi:hypothetical protein
MIRYSQEEEEFWCRIKDRNYAPVVSGYDDSRATESLGIQWIDLEKSTVDNIKSLLDAGAHES